MLKGKSLVFIALLILMSGCAREPVVIECRLNRLQESFVYQIEDVEACQSYFDELKAIKFNTIYTNTTITLPTQLAFTFKLNTGVVRMYMLHKEGVITYYDGDRLKQGDLELDIYAKYNQMLDDSKTE